MKRMRKSLWLIISLLVVLLMLLLVLPSAADGAVSEIDTVAVLLNDGTDLVLSGSLAPADRAGVVTLRVVSPYGAEAKELSVCPDPSGAFSVTVPVPINAIGDEFAVTLVKDGVPLDASTRTVSVRSYLVELLSDGATAAPVRDVCTSLLRYGEAVLRYLDHTAQADALVAGLELPTDTPAVPTCAASVSGSGYYVALTSYGLALDTRLSLYALADLRQNELISFMAPRGVTLHVDGTYGAGVALVRAGLPVSAFFDAKDMYLLDIASYVATPTLSVSAASYAAAMWDDVTVGPVVRALTSYAYAVHALVGEHVGTGNATPSGEGHTALCRICGVTYEEEHAPVLVSEESPTCAADGVRRSICTVCTAPLNEVLPATGEHSYVWTNVTAPTALIDGEDAYRCTVCQGEGAERRAVPAAVRSMPILYMTGDYASATKTVDVTMEVRYVTPEDGEVFSCAGTIHWQGATSASFPKKNYTLKLYKDTTLAKKNKVDLGWGKESKYCLKANWVDTCQARNVVSCRIWSDVVEARPDSTLRTRLLNLKTNAGAIDGYPIAVYMNGEFHGLYTLNVPKDNWMFDMGDVETEAMLMADNWNTALDTHIEGFYVNSADDWVSLDNAWELKHFGTEDTTGDPQWVATSFNTLMDFIKNNDGDAFREGIDTYLDVDAAIDYMLYMYAIYMRDNSAKNILWVTYDGVKWFPSVYDQDGTFGMVWDGIRSASTTGMLPSVNATTGIVDDQIADNNSTILWNKLLNLFTERVVERYRELRADALSEENILAHFAAFAAEVPDGIYEADRLAWKTEYESYVQGKYAQYGYDFSSWSWYGFGYEYIADWVPARLAKMDAAIDRIADVCLGE